ncbi:TorF family putative porin [Glaciecola sp. MF2-115]|uniref:TorF family putative porin n=1 Tax=Glaciecola sp. MF2-115 TaxID=3384827 RepID=UPI0039A06038
MKTFKRTAMAATILSTALLSQTAMAEWSANIGLVSDYHFRGIQQTESASTSAGLDYAGDTGFYAGAWTAEVEDGLEVDLYAGYGIELDNGVSLDANFTTYQYTGDFDSAYNEIGLGAGFGLFSVGYVQGKWDGVVGDEAATEGDYSLVTIGIEKDGWSATIGSYGKDAEGEYGEIAYGTEIGGFDVGVGLVLSGSDLDDSESLYFSISKSFDL